MISTQLFMFLNNKRWNGFFDKSKNIEKKE